MCVASRFVFQWFLKVETIGQSNVSTCAFVSFRREKCLGERKMLIKRWNFEQWDENRRPLRFPKERGGEKACTARRGTRRCVWYVSWIFVLYMCVFRINIAMSSIYVPRLQYGYLPYGTVHLCTLRFEVKTISVIRTTRYGVDNIHRNKLTM